MAKIAYRSGGGGFFDTQRQRSLRVHTPQQQQGVPVHFLKPRKEKEEALSFQLHDFRRRYDFTVIVSKQLLLSENCKNRCDDDDDEKNAARKM
jgi:hypothetical protein